MPEPDRSPDDLMTRLPDAGSLERPQPLDDDRLRGPRLVGVWLGLVVTCWLVVLLIGATTVAVVRWLW